MYIPSIISNLKKKLKQETPVEKHVQKVLMNSKVGKISSVGLLLSYKYHIEVAEALADHNYSKVPLFDAKVIDIDPNKSIKIRNCIDKQYICCSPESKNNKEDEGATLINKILMQNELEINIVNSHAVYEDSSNILLHDEINKQLSNNAGYVQIDLKEN